LILRKISKIGSTRCHILRLTCTKFNFRWGSAPDPAPDPLAVFKGAILRGGRRKGGAEGKGSGREKKGRGGNGKEGRVAPSS